MHRFLIVIFPLLFLFFSPLLCANDAGGGVSGVGANVTLTTSSSSATLSNGVITAVISKSTGKVTSYLMNGTQMVDTSGTIYYSMDGGTSYENPANCVYSVTTNTSDMVDISCKMTWANNTTRVHALDIDCHYVLRRGDTGLYAYAILSHPASYPATTMGEWRMVWKLPHSSTAWTFERIYADAIRNWKWGTYTDYTSMASTSIAEIKKFTTGARIGQYDCKYEYSLEYQDAGCWGHASDTNKKGVWFVLGSYDYLNDGPIKNDLAVAEAYSLVHFGRNHYNGSSTNVAAGETWSKIYGPFLLYCNATTATTNAGNTLWTDAKAQVQAEIAASPYSWLVNSDYPSAANRGSVSGKIIISDPLKPTLAAGVKTWIGLSQPDAGGNWQFESKRYQSWVHPDASGNFTIPAMRPGSYTLSVFTDGAVGEYTHPTPVTIVAGANTALGDVTWTVPHPGGSIAWEIGIPDRRAGEFRHSENYWYPFLWETFSSEFSNPLEYNVGTSNWATDWNFAHTAYTSGGVATPWKWRINFNLSTLPVGGDAIMTFAFASINYGAVQVYVNNESTPIGEVSTTTAGGGTGGNALVREGNHAKYSLGYFTVPVSALQLGANTITLVQRKMGYSEHVMYDYINLELPASPPPPPPGRDITWAGGNNANAWDDNTTNNFLDTTNTATTFVTGDNVSITQSGSNSPEINKVGSLTPSYVLLNATKNYTIGGTGTLDGTMAMVKQGTNVVILNGTNNFIGGTTIVNGTIQLGLGELSNAGIGLGPITFLGGKLQLNGYGLNDNGSTYYGALPNNLIVPLGYNGTLLCPKRISVAGISGTLTGAGTLNVVVDYVRGAMSGNWSNFTGQINVNVRSNTTGGQFRIKNNYGYEKAAMNLAANTKIFNIDGNNHTIKIGELSGSGSLCPDSLASLNPTWQIGARNSDSTFSGSILDSGSTSLTKVGTGTLTLSGLSNNYSGATNVNAGTLQITGAITTTNTVTVANTATLDVAGTVTANTVQVNSGGTLIGCGNVNATLINNGTVIGSCGTTLQITGDVTNNGIMQFINGSGISATGTFTNNGTLDLITGNQTLPANFINNGTVLLASDVVLTSYSYVGGVMTLNIKGYAGHIYRLQRSSTLLENSWQDIGPSQDGEGSILTFTDNPVGNKNFFRIIVSP